ncbi:MAG: S49 family peptidase [Acidobacteriota bacterium]
MKRKGLVITLVVVIVIGIGVAVVLGLLAAAGLIGKPSVARQTILELDLEQPVIEAVPDSPAGQLLMKELMTTRTIVEALLRGAEDDRVVALVARIGGGGLSMAQAQEIRDAVAAFRESGKPAIAFAETFGEVGPGNVGYYVATAFDEIWLQPSGDLGLTGFMLESPFIRKTLDKLDIKVRMDHRYEYKNAMNTFTETKFTAPHREALEALLDAWHGQLVAGIAQGREIAPDEVERLIDRGPYLGREAVDAGLVDRLGYRDEMLAALREDVGESARLLYVSRYRQRAGGPWAKGRRIALVYGVGAVTRGESAFDVLSGTQTMGSDSVTRALRAATEDDDVVAIVFRVDSPGGSYVASDAIWREVNRARDAGKPVIVSMGGVAGSGGYFVAMSADRILAQPGTITGSIGVLGGKFVTTGFWDKLGVTFDEVHRAENATMYSSIRDYSPFGWSRHQAWLDRVYDDFTRKVAEGRSLPLERVREIAKGRIWAGSDALELGLVDELGGLARAVELARELAGLEPDEPVALRVYPRPKGLLEALRAGQRESSEQVLARELQAILARVQPAVRLAERVGLVEPAERPLAVPELPAVR